MRYFAQHEATPGIPVDLKVMYEPIPPEELHKARTNGGVLELREYILIAGLVTTGPNSCHIGNIRDITPTSDGSITFFCTDAAGSPYCGMVLPVLPEDDFPYGYTAFRPPLRIDDPPTVRF